METDFHPLVPNGPEVADDILEAEASFSFISKILNNFDNTKIPLHTCNLEDAIAQNCFAPWEKKRCILLYFYNSEDVFSKTFCSIILKQEAMEVIDRSFFLLGWDIEDKKYHKALQNSLEKNNLYSVVNVLKSNISAALIIVPINEIPLLKFYIRGKSTEEDILKNLLKAEEFLKTEKEQEQNLCQLVDVNNRENDIGSTNFQQLMAEMLGDRDYDSFDFNQHDHLKDKIGFALYGPPQKDQEKNQIIQHLFSGYEPKQQKNIQRICNVILEQSNKIAEYKDRVEISFIYNCTEPLPEEKLKRAKKFKDDYNPTTDINPIPIFVLRKCRESQNGCRVFIDQTGRVYENWQGYILKNKLPQCVMVLPKDGRYQFYENGNVMLEDRKLSPSCDVSAKILKGTDIASTTTGIISTGIIAAAAIPAITVAPALLVTGVGMGIAVGLYSIGRSSYGIYDRIKHKETMSFANSEARGAYLNIVAGSLGFVGAGANMAVAQLAMRGVNIGKGAGVVVNTISIVNLSASGASLLNSGYDVFDQWINENQTPSLLTIVQLSSSVLFFGNAVYNFKLASTIVDESQASVLKDYHESLRSNRHRKTFDKLLKETIAKNSGNAVKGRADVISTIRNIQNKDEVFAVLTRNNKMLNKEGVKFSAENGEIRLNGIAVDMNEFAAMNKNEAKSFVTRLPEKSTPTPAESLSIKNTVTNYVKNLSLDDVQKVYMSAQKVIAVYNEDVEKLICIALSTMLTKLDFSVKSWLNKMFPGHEMFMRLFEMLVNFFGKAADDLEEQRKKWLETQDPIYYNKIFDIVNLDLAKRTLQFFEYGIKAYYMGTVLTENALKELMSYFTTWFTKQVTDYSQRQEQQEKRLVHSATSRSTKVGCPNCEGVYFVPMPS